MSHLGNTPGFSVHIAWSFSNSKNKEKSIFYDSLIHFTIRKQAKIAKIELKSLPYSAIKNGVKSGRYYEPSRKYPDIFGSHSLIILKVEK